MTNKPLILIVNDDGIHSPGLPASAEVAAELGEVLIVAPNEQQTGMSRARPFLPGMGVIEETPLTIGSETVVGYAVVSAPALCVAHALMELTPRQPDLCLSGINYGENIGWSLTGSGTLGAALEAAAYGVPAIASSLETPMSMTHSKTYADLDWAAAKHHLRVLATTILERGMPDGVAVMNLNVPSDATPETEQRITSLSYHSYYTYDYYGPNYRPYDQPFRLTESRIADRNTLEPDSDVYAFVHDRVVSVTPIARTLSAPLDGVRQWRA